MEKIQCVYKITNKVNKKVYIGSAIDFNRRKRRHFYLLRKGNHHSIKLQNSFNKYGEEKFIIKIIEIVDDVNELIKREQYWIDKVKPALNMTLIAGLNSHLGLKRSQETKDKIRKALTGKKLSPEHIEACRLGLLGHKQSEETKNKRSMSIKNSEIAKLSYQSITRKEKTKKTRLENGGYVITEKMKKQISATLKAQNLQSAISIEIEKYDLENNLIEIYPSMTKAEIANNIGRGRLSHNIIKRGKKVYKGFNWKINK